MKNTFRFQYSNLYTQINVKHTRIDLEFYYHRSWSAMTYTLNLSQVMEGKVPKKDNSYYICINLLRLANFDFQK